MGQTAASNVVQRRKQRSSVEVEFQVRIGRAKQRAGGEGGVGEENERKLKVRFQRHS
jgi:hypothetical protein